MCERERECVSVFEGCATRRQPSSGTPAPTPRRAPHRPAAAIDPTAHRLQPEELAGETQPQPRPSLRGSTHSSMEARSVVARRDRMSCTFFPSPRYSVRSALPCAVGTCAGGGPGVASRRCGAETRRGWQKVSRQAAGRPAAARCRHLGSFPTREAWPPACLHELDGGAGGAGLVASHVALHACGPRLVAAARRRQEGGSIGEAARACACVHA